MLKIQMVLVGLFSLLFIIGCAESEEEDRSMTDGDSVDGDESADDDDDNDNDDSTEDFVAYTTLKQRLEPTFGEHGEDCEGENEDEPYCENPASQFPDLDAYFNHESGQWEVSAGEAFTRIPVEGVDPGEYGDRRSLFSWAHMSDIHITDEESPNRMGSFDTKGIPSALRPMDMFSEITLDSAVRTINYFHSVAPLDLVVVTGDFTDNAQKNEATNFVGVINGGTIDPDSGNDDDPVAGPGNDPQDVFEAEGLNGIPWIAALGNHDTLILGNWEITQENKDRGMGDSSLEGTRDGTTYEVINGDIPPDTDREPLTHPQMIKLIHDAVNEPGGHGFKDDNVQNGHGYYVYDPPDSIVRFIVLDSTYRPQGYEGDGFTFVGAVIDNTQFNDFLGPQLDQSVDDNKLVIVAMHHGSWAMQDDGHPDRFVATSDFLNLLTSYPNVLALTVGHSHENTLAPRQEQTNEGALFEVQASSLLDWPQQFRMYELVDNGNGTLSLFTVVCDHAAEEGSLAEFSRQLSLIDVQSTWGEGGPGIPGQRNVEMVFDVPLGFEDAITQATGSDQVRSLTNWTE